jgi:methylmalonyl-CoA/ethylmalonyl-CoA epimerase
MQARDAKSAEAAMESGPGIRRIGQIAVTVRDTDRAAQFYRDVLQLPHLFDAPPSMSFFDCGGVRLMLAVPEGGEHDHASSILYLDVADIRRSHDVLAGRGVLFEREPHKVADLGERELWLAFFRDSEANMLALMSEVRKGEAEV